MSKLSSLILGVILICAPGLFSQAQPPEQFPAAPVPPAIASAKKVFIANNGTESNYQMVRVAWYKGGPNQTYDEFYAAVKSWGRFELVNSPAEADIVFEISFDNRYVNLSQLKLVIVDPKTHIPLWMLVSYVEYAGRSKNREKNYETAMQSLIEDLKSLVSSQK